MQRINSPDQLFHDGDPSEGVPGTPVFADWLNSLQEEVAGVVEGAGIDLDPESRNQLFEAIGILMSAAGFAPVDHDHDEKADKVRRITAGNGLTGGGDLSADRALALGTPGDLSGSTPNAATANSHTHRLLLASEAVAGAVALASDSDAMALAHALRVITPRTLGLVLAVYALASHTHTAAQVGAAAASHTHAWSAITGRPDIADQPTMTGSATFTRSSNAIALTNIRTALSLEIGDVIEVTGSTNNNNLYTVESITNANTIVVNYEHRNGAGSLSLTNETRTVTIKRLVKWFNAPTGIGHGWLDFTSSSSRAINTAYKNTTGRPIVVKVGCGSFGTENIQLSADGALWLNFGGAAVGFGYSEELIVPDGWHYKSAQKETTYSRWLELR